MKHSKSQPVEPSIEELVEETVMAQPETPLSAGLSPEDAHAAIARLAYGYWEARGCTGGSAEEDWLRAEAEYLKLLAV
jgi:hypothetical protein